MPFLYELFSGSVAASYGHLAKLVVASGMKADGSLKGGGLLLCLPFLCSGGSENAMVTGWKNLLAISGVLF